MMDVEDQQSRATMRAALGKMSLRGLREVLKHKLYPVELVDEAIDEVVLEYLKSAERSRDPLDPR